MGLAFDFCVGSTALDAKKHGFDTYVVAEGTKSVSKETELIMEEKLKKSNIPVISFDSIKMSWFHITIFTHLDLFIILTVINIVFIFYTL